MARWGGQLTVGSETVSTVEQGPTEDARDVVYRAFFGDGRMNTRNIIRVVNELWLVRYTNGSAAGNVDKAFEAIEGHSHEGSTLWQDLEREIRYRPQDAEGSGGVASTLLRLRPRRGNDPNVNMYSHHRSSIQSQLGIVHTAHRAQFGFPHPVR